jgi:phosphopantetheine attachment domain protein
VVKKIIGIMKKMRPYEEITETTELIESGILDSLVILHLAAQLEIAFDVEIADEALTAVNFANADAIAQLVRKSKGI